MGDLTLEQVRAAERPAYNDDRYWAFNGVNLVAGADRVPLVIAGDVLEVAVTFSPPHHTTSWFVAPGARWHHLPGCDCEFCRS